MATPTQEEFVRSLTLAVRPGSLRAPVLTYSRPEDQPLPPSPAAPPQYQPVTRAMALFMSNILLVGWAAVMNLMQAPTLADRENAALAALELAEPKETRVAIASMPADMVAAMIARMQPANAESDQGIEKFPDIPHPRDTRGYASIDRALSAGSSLSMQERRQLQEAVSRTVTLAYESHLANDLIATGSIPKAASDSDVRQASAQGVGQGDRAKVRRINIDMDKPPLRGSL